MPLVGDGVRKHLRGVTAGLLASFDDDLDIEHDELAANTTTFYDRGIRTFLASAGISEYHSLIRQEHVDVAAAAVNTLPSDVCILTDVGGSTASARELINVHDHIGVDGVMITPPDHIYVHEHGLLCYYKKLAEASTTPLVPHVKGFNPSVNYLRDLVGFDGVVGIKCVTEDAIRLGAAINTTGDDVVRVDGLAEPFTVSLQNEGIEGFLVDVNNFRPEVGLALFEAFTKENWGHVRKLRNICLSYRNFRDQTRQDNSLNGTISVLVVKKGFELAGLHGGTVCKPIQSLLADDGRRAKELYDQLDDDIECLID